MNAAQPLAIENQMVMNTNEPPFFASALFRVLCGQGEYEEAPADHADHAEANFSQF
jgi:hypothetical protein